ncbi:hypothetical protein KKD37_02895 [Patescibacteria group bacterium]|nr:hypothetical protein [Patescibacteria group bacterium]
MAIDQTPQPPSESVVKTETKATSPLLTLYNNILTEVSEHSQAVSAWETNAEILKNAGQEPGPKPEGSELSRLGDIYLPEANIYSRNVASSMSDATASDAYFLSTKTEAEKAEIRQTGAARVDTLVDQINGYDGEEPEKGIVGLFRTTRTIEELMNVPGTSKFDHIATLVDSRPEALHTCKGIFSRFVDSHIYQLSDTHNSPFPKEDSTLHLLTLLADKETSPLSDPEQKNAKLLLHESAGYNLYGILKGKKIDSLTPETIEIVTGGLITQEVWNLINAESADTLAEKIGGLSRKDGQENREELQALALGMIRATLDTARTIKSNDSNSNADGLRIHAAKGLLALTDPETESILQIKGDNHSKYIGFLYDEIKNIYAANENQLASQAAARLLWERNTAVTEIQDAPRREAQEKEAQEKREKLAQQETAKKEALATASQEMLDGLAKNPTILYLLGEFYPGFKAQDGEIPPRSKLLTAINDFKESYRTKNPQLYGDKDVYAFFNNLSSKLSSISGNDILENQRQTELPKIYSDSTYTVVDKAGFFGIGKETHDERKIDILPAVRHRLELELKNIQEKYQDKPGLNSDSTWATAIRLFLGAYPIVR